MPPRVHASRITTLSRLHVLKPVIVVLVLWCSLPIAGAQPVASDRPAETERAPTGVIIEVDDDLVLWRMGTEARIRAGDQFVILRDEVRAPGELETARSGLLVAQSVEGRVFSGVGRVASPPPRVEETVERLPQGGVALAATFEVHTDGISIVNLPRVIVTARSPWYPWRAVASLEVPVHGLPELRFLHANLTGGAEWSTVAGRIRLSPSLAGGVSFALPVVSDPALAPIYLGHVGAVARATGSMLVTRSVEVSVSLGYGLWYGLHEESAPPYRELAAYHGLIVGAGVTFR